MADKTPMDKDNRHLVLLAENMEGYTNLCRLATLAQRKGFYYKPRIDKEVLQQYSKGLICLSSLPPWRNSHVHHRRPDAIG